MEHTWSCIVLLVMCLCLTAVRSQPCPMGLISKDGQCLDANECDDDPYICGNNATCTNTNGSFYCQCVDGFRTSSNLPTFTAESGVTCIDFNECRDDKNICGPYAKCNNTIGHYKCICNTGFIPYNVSVLCIDIDECQRKDICGKNANCQNTPGGYYCVCNPGFRLRSGKRNFSGAHEKCEELNCEISKDLTHLKKNFPQYYDLTMQLTNQCKKLAENNTATALDGHDILKRLLFVIDELLSNTPFRNNSKVSTFLDSVEGILRLTGSFIMPPGVNESTSYTELELRVLKGSVMPQGNVTLSLKDAKLDIQMETVAGERSQYPDFATVSLLGYKNLKDSADDFFDGVKKQEGETFEINSKVVTVTVSNRNTSHLNEPVNITFYHLQQTNQTSHCVFWDSSMKGGAWSSRGCSVKESNPKYTVCSCDHLSSFAVLMALYEVEDRFELRLITWVGLSLSLVCLFICILTFALIRSIQSPRTKIHLHLCISLFLAFFIFLIGISRTENKVGCAVVAGLLHFFFLASFCWMCLEGIQLFRMVVLVFNTSFRTAYVMAAGYGVPAVIVTISALANVKGYGTERYCWLSVDSIWSFFGPACVIIVINIVFFLITVWKLAQKFSSLNPDLDNLQKIKAFTITAVAQLCVLGLMWIFGCFQFDETTIAMSYLFTIFASLQGVMLFVMHCLFSKQVRDEYRNILSRCCAPQKKTYSEFGYTNSSKAQGSKSTHDTGESQM